MAVIKLQIFSFNDLFTTKLNKIARTGKGKRVLKIKSLSQKLKTLCNSCKRTGFGNVCKGITQIPGKFQNRILHMYTQLPASGV